MSSQSLLIGVIALESLAAIAVIIGVCMLIWGDFSDEQPAAKPVRASPAARTGKPAAPAPRPAKVGTQAPAAPKVLLTKPAAQKSSTGEQ